MKEKILDKAMAVDGLMSREELSLLYDHAKECSSTMIEIGAYRGRSTIVLAGAKNLAIKFFSIDVWSEHQTQERYKSSYPIYRQNLKDAGYWGKVIPLNLSSEDAYDVVIGNYGRHIGFVFIDGNHSYDSVKRDYELYAKRARVVAFHDYALDKSYGKGTYKFVNELLEDSHVKIDQKGMLILLERKEMSLRASRGSEIDF